MESFADQDKKILNENINQNEFAVKEPLLSKKTKKAITISFILVILISLTGFIGITVFNNINKKPIIVNPTNINSTPTPTPTEKPYTPQIAYIKDKKTIWTVDFKGQNKTLVKELAKSDTSYFNYLDWKDKNILSYVLCQEEKKKSFCSVESINIDNKSIEEDVKVENKITKFAWSNNKKFLAFVEQDNENTILKLKTGTIINTLSTSLNSFDPLNINSRITFNNNDENIIYSAVKKELIQKSRREFEEVNKNVLEVFLLNGTKIDEVSDATDMFVISDIKLGYKKNNQLYYKEIGVEGETLITPISGNNPVISENKELISYWTTTSNGTDITMGLFDSDLNIHRNILKGIAFPYWITNDTLIGIEVDNCIGKEVCQLYEFQSNGLVLVDIDKNSVIPIDQGKTISQVSFRVFK